MALTADMFPKLEPAKDGVGSVSKTPLDSQHVKESQTLLKSA